MKYSPIVGTSIRCWLSVAKSKSHQPTDERCLLRLCIVAHSHKRPAPLTDPILECPFDHHSLKPCVGTLTGADSSTNRGRHLEIPAWILLTQTLRLQMFFAGEHRHNQSSILTRVSEDVF